MVEEKLLKELKFILGELYLKYGNTDEVIMLSQLVDKLL